MDKILHIIKRIIPTRLFKALQPAYHYLLSWLSAAVYRFPSEKLIVVGVTGTTGKTTSVYLIAKALEAAGIKTGYTSTAMFNDGKREWLNDKKMTMVGRFFTQKIISDMFHNGCQVAIIETTSEGIRQFRHRFINYDILVFTGLYEEHIDSHGSFEKYKEAKGRLFDHLMKCQTKHIDDKLTVEKNPSGLKKIELRSVKKTIIVNGDDRYAEYFLGFKAERKIAYAQKELKAEKGLEILEYSDVRADNKGVSFKVSDFTFNLKMLGSFNAANSMNAVAVGKAMDLDMKNLKSGLEKIDGVAGRLEKIDVGQDFTVIVDYAFEPKALAKLYETLEFIPHKNIIHVLGSTGGGRDVARRPKLGALAGEKAQIVIVTNEDPYDDDPEVIISQVALGAENAGKKLNIDLFKVSDRFKAIEKALSIAKENDIIIITGKGSEQAICAANGEKIPWDDRAVARGLLNKL
jgi:UDP-N-acetylmuramoyl-L-alanyl-D-glutamate--2,6-diaminopimelate ligase